MLAPWVLEPTEQPTAFALAAARDDELRQFVAAEAQLRALTVHPDFHTDEDRIYDLMMVASKLCVGLEAGPPADSKAFDEAQRLLKAILGMVTAWMRLATTGRLVPNSEGLRGAVAAQLAFGVVESLVVSTSGLGASMTLTFKELGGLSLMGKALCSVDEGAFNYALQSLCVVAGRLNARGQRGSDREMTRVLEDAGFWKRFVQTSSRAQAHPTITALLSHEIVGPRELMDALGKAGAFSVGSIPTSCRVALQWQILLCASEMDLEAILEIYEWLSAFWGFEELSEEGIDLLSRLTTLAFESGYRMSLTDCAAGRLLGVTYLLQYLQWGYRQEAADISGLLEFAKKTLVHVLLCHTALAPFLPAIAAHALTMAAEPYEGPTSAASCSSKVLCTVALAAASTASVGHGVSPASAIALLCGAVPRVGQAPPFRHEDKEYWVCALVDALCTFLRLPNAEIGPKEIATLWSRLVVRPIFGLSVAFAAGQYFKLAFLARPAPSETILAPFLAAPNPPHEISRAFSSLYRSADSEEAEALQIPLFQVQATEKSEEMDLAYRSPPRLPQPLRHSMSSDHEVDLNLGALTQVAAQAGITMVEPSTSVPRMRLDRVQAATQSHSGLFGELTVYDATERRLWDEFDELGRIDDVDALRQRDAAARRCLAALDKEIDAVGRAGRELPSALTEARAKFSILCQLVEEGGAKKAGQRMNRAEHAFSKAEDDLFVASFEHRRTAARCRRSGQAAPAEVPDARARTRAHLELIKEIRLAAQFAQLGLVEITGLGGFARAIRAAGPAHGDPLLERLLRHRRWCDQQARGDPVQDVTQKVPVEKEPVVEALADADGSPMGRRSKLVRRPMSQAVVIKESCQQEVRALQKLRGHPNVMKLLKVMQSGDGSMYLELPFCAGGSLLQWCEKFGSSILQGDADTFVRCLSIWRQIWQAVAYIHMDGVFHGQLTLENVLLTAEQRPILAEFGCCVIAGQAGPRRSPPADYTAPEFQADDDPTAAGDVYSAGVAMAKAFMGLELQVGACPYHPTRGQRSLPEERTDVDLADLLQQVLAESPTSRPSATLVSSHRALDPAGFLRRRGLLGVPGLRTPSESFLEAAEALREEYRGRRMDEPLMLSRDDVFETIAHSKVGEWKEDALLGEWRVMLNDESGVDGGGLRREVVSLFFEQLESSSLVMRAAMDGSDVVTLFVNDRRRADKSPEQWRQVWTSVGAMLLRALVHFGNAPLACSSAVFDCALGRLCKLPPDDVPGGDDDAACIDRLLELREEKGDDWARSELLDLLRRLRRADPQKEAGYRWMLSQRSEEDGVFLASSLPLDVMETISAMLEPRSSKLLERLATPSSNSVIVPDASLEWVLLWDVYLKFLGGGDRWLAYESLAAGFTAHGRRHDMWSVLTGDQVVETLEGVPLTSDVILPNLEFKPGYGYETQIQFFRNVIAAFSSEELSMFLRFSTGIGRLPASRKFPAGQKLTIRFMPDQLENLPSAHTCFWVVNVPPYEDQEDLARKLRLAIAAPQPFELS